MISHAGSLTNLAKYPASTVQILGAEKALFRYGSEPPQSVEAKGRVIDLIVILFPFSER